MIKIEVTREQAVALDCLLYQLTDAIEGGTVGDEMGGLKMMSRRPKPWFKECSLDLTKMAARPLLNIQMSLEQAG
jgi:hypothetical protein